MSSRVTLSIKATGIDLEIPVDVNLSSIYLDPEVLLSKFFKPNSLEWEESFEQALSIIFDGGKHFDNFLISIHLSITDEERRSALAMLFVDCYATYWFGLRNYNDKMKSVSKTKNLGDFQVSYRGDANTDTILKMIGEAKSCLDNLKKLLTDTANANIGRAIAFSLRDSTARVTNVDTRLWDHRNLELGIAYAATKRQTIGGQVYKTGAFYQYWMIGRTNFNGWGYDGSYQQYF